MENQPGRSLMDAQTYYSHSEGKSPDAFMKQHLTRSMAAGGRKNQISLSYFDHIVGADDLHSLLIIP